MLDPAKPECDDNKNTKFFFLRIKISKNSQELPNCGDAVLPEDGQARRAGGVLLCPEEIRGRQYDAQGADAVGGKVPPQDGRRRRLPGSIKKLRHHLEYLKEIK